MPNSLDRDEYLLHQRVTLMVNRYEVFVPAAPGSKEKGELLVFVEQRRMKLKEEINFYADESKSTVLFSVKADKVFDPGGSYQLLDPAGGVIARFKKKFKQSLLQSTWVLQDAAGNETGGAKERSLLAALFRRFAGLVPYVGDFLNLIPIAYNFDFTSTDGKLMAVNSRIWGIRDRYRIEVTPDGRDLDRRLLIAIAVCMDALQSR